MQKIINKQTNKQFHVTEGITVTNKDLKDTG